MNDFIKRIKLSNTESIVPEADPNAEMFYSKLGFLKIGQVKTDTDGRYLPIMKLNIS